MSIKDDKIYFWCWQNRISEILQYKLLRTVREWFLMWIFCFLSIVFLFRTILICTINIWSTNRASLCAKLVHLLIYLNFLTLICWKLRRSENWILMDQESILNDENIKIYEQIRNFCTSKSSLFANVRSYPLFFFIYAIYLKNAFL